MWGWGGVKLWVGWGGVRFKVGVGVRVKVGWG